jgi:diaminohydroxyphosphoribosylaminopyrimidine deaminase / 5-amino-6-(5-phosphoribosylamino)uracil reductase
MSQTVGTTHGRTPRLDRGEDWAWTVVLGAAAAAEMCETAGRTMTFASGGDADLQPVPADHPDAVIAWRPQSGWSLLLSPDHRQHPLIDLYLPICNATESRPITVGHLGASLDGFIATHAGESQFVTGRENLRHMHRMRALCDAIVVGAGTVAADDPQLTTRHVPGPSPLRVILDPGRRLTDQYRVFSDEAADTLYVCPKSLTQPGESHFGRAAMMPVDDEDGSLDAAGVLALLRRRGCHRIFIEGGGVTVSTFLESNLLDRLQMAIAPLIIGEGRPAIRLQPPATLGDCRRPRYRVFRMGGDVLFDCDLRSDGADLDPQPLLERIL